MATLVEGAVWHAQSSSRLCRCSRRDTTTDHIVIVDALCV